MSRWLQSAAGSSLTDFFTLKMEAIRSSETSVHTRSTRRHIPEDGILHLWVLIQDVQGSNLNLDTDCPDRDAV
jgi:hypothetical protein